MLHRIWVILFVLMIAALSSCSHFVLTSPVAVEPTQPVRRLAVRAVIMDTPDNTPMASPVQVGAVLAFTNEFMSPLRIHLFVETLTYMPYSQFYDRDWIQRDACKYPNQISVYFLPARTRMSLWVSPGGSVGDLSGYSAWPWSKYPHGILLFGNADMYTLAHELGHYFGLYHTHEGNDLVDDTKDGIDPTYDNFMNYTICASRSITAGQIKRMNFFLVNYRSEVGRSNYAN